MMYARLAAFAGAATMVLCGAVHAAPPAQPALAPAQPMVVATVVQLPVRPMTVAETPAVRDGGMQMAMNTFDGPRPGSRPGTMPGNTIAPGPFSSYLLSATRAVQDVGSFWSGPEEAPKISEAPLPGALWLFGSALLAFLAISVRRKF
jgi:hypothetical protein